jgi:xylose isomerase
MAETGVKLLWGTANVFSHPRYAAGAATNPDPEVFAYAAAQVRHMMEITHRLGGENYVLWGGREGYETLLNTDLAREEAQLARFLTLVAEHKREIGFEGRCCSSPSRRNRPSTSTTTTRRPSTASSNATTSSASTRSTSRATTPPWLVTASTTRSPTRSTTGSSAASTPTAATRRTGGTPTSSRTRSRSSRWCSSRSCGAGGWAPAGSTSTPSSAARASTATTSSTVTSAASTRWLERSWSRRSSTRTRRCPPPAPRRYADWEGALGRAIADGSATLASLADQVVDGSIDPAAEIRTTGAAGEPRQPSDLADVTRPARGRGDRRPYGGGG